MKHVRDFKHHPAVLVWGIGNEAESEGDNPAIWSHIEHLAQLVKREDPYHPVMTVIAEMGGKKIEAIHKLCPSVDIIGINSYGGAQSLPDRYKRLGGKKPYIVTEFGPIGTWEVGKNAIDAISEPSSTKKALSYFANAKTFAKDKAILPRLLRISLGQQAGRHGDMVWNAAARRQANCCSRCDD